MVFFHRKPNLIVILLDQFRADRVNRLPILAKIRKQGVFFPEMITYAPYTLASVHAILTGIYGYRNGVDAYYGAPKFDKNNCYTLAQHLRDYGFYNKLDTFSKMLFPYQGFHNVGEYSENDDEVISRHMNTLKQMKKYKRFFLFLHYGAIHTYIINNIVKKYDYTDQNFYSNFKENNQIYDNLIDDCGLYVHSLWEYIERSFINDTIVIFMSDHGGSLGEKWGELCYGVFTYDYTLKIWAIMVGAQEKFQKNFIWPSMIRSVDLVPTLLDIYGIKPVPFCKPMDGTVIDLNDTNPRIAFSETAGLSGPYPSPFKPNIHCVRSSGWKLIWNRTTDKKELYNLKSDPNETENLYGQGISQERILDKQLLRYLQR